MAGLKLDGAGTAKMATLDEALVMVQALHGVVERMALEVRNGSPISSLTPALKRVGTPLAAKLKAQYGMVSDQVTQMLLMATRGGGDQVKVRALREGVAQVRTALDIAVAKVKENHAMKDHSDQADQTADAGA